MGQMSIPFSLPFQQGMGLMFICRERAKQAIVDMKGLHQIVALLGEHSGAQAAAPSLAALRGCQLMHHLLQRNGSLQVRPCPPPAMPTAATVDLETALGSWAGSVNLAFQLSMMIFPVIDDDLSSY